MRRNKKMTRENTRGADAEENWKMILTGDKVNEILMGLGEKV
jgi:hypothetical protein